MPDESKISRTDSPEKPPETHDGMEAAATPVEIPAYRCPVQSAADAVAALQEDGALYRIKPRFPFAFDVDTKHLEAANASRVAEIAERMAMKAEADFREWWKQGKHLDSTLTTRWEELSTTARVMATTVARRAFIAGRASR